MPNEHAVSLVNNHLAVMALAPKAMACATQTMPTTILSIFDGRRPKMQGFFLQKRTVRDKIHISNQLRNQD